MFFIATMVLETLTCLTSYFKRKDMVDCSYMNLTVKPNKLVLKVGGKENGQDFSSEIW